MYDEKLLRKIKKMMILRYPRFASQIAGAELCYRTNLPFRTASTDGKNIFFDPDFIAGLTEDEQLFIVAHELMHVKFRHMDRIVDKNGQRRDPHLWNIATDAIINANLERDGFTIRKGYINMPEALKYTAEEFYDKLLSEQKTNPQKFSNMQSSDDHTLWGEAKEDSEQQGEQSGDFKPNFDKNPSQNTPQNTPQNSKPQDDYQEQEEFDEREEFNKNRQERRQRAQEDLGKLRSETGAGMGDFRGNLGEIGEEKPVVDWRLLLRREIERAEVVWSQRKAIAENNYAYRLDEEDVEDEAETEVMIDVSGSVTDDLVRSFLRQLKPIVRESKLKIGFFGNEATKEFQEIKTERDIDKVKIRDVGRGTNMDSAVRAFSSKKEVNKIVFTDGYPGIEPKSDLKDVNVLWLVYENRNFHPCCGKVIDVFPPEKRNSTNCATSQEVEMSR